MQAAGQRANASYANAGRMRSAWKRVDAPPESATGLHFQATLVRFTSAMSPRYIAARRPDGSPSRHLTRRQLGRMRTRFQRLVLLMATTLLTAACVIR